METAAKQSLETKAGSSVRPVQPRSVGGTVGSDSKRQGPWPRGPAHGGASTHAVQEAVKSGARFPQPLMGRGADSLSCSDGAVSSVSPLSRPHWVTGWPGTQLPFPPPRGERPASCRLEGSTPAPPWGSWCQCGWSIGTASAEEASPGHGSQGFADGGTRDSEREVTAPDCCLCLGKASRVSCPRKERHFLLSKIFLFVHSLLAALGLVLGVGFLRCVSGSCCPLLWLLLLWSTGSRAWASLPRGMWGPPGPGVRPMAPALARGFLAAGPLGPSSSQTTCKTRLMSAFLTSLLNMKVIFFYFKNGRKLEDADPFAQR